MRYDVGNRSTSILLCGHLQCRTVETKRIVSICSPLHARDKVIIYVKAKVKLSRYCHVGVKGKRRYSSYTLLTSSLGVVSDYRHAPAAL